MAALLMTTVSISVVRIWTALVPGTSKLIKDMDRDISPLYVLTTALALCLVLIRMRTVLPGVNSGGGHCGTWSV
jgi:hypothetical protein